MAGAERGDWEVGGAWHVNYSSQFAAAAAAVVTVTMFVAAVAFVGLTEAYKY